jgi:hypothetical protein
VTATAKIFQKEERPVPARFVPLLPLCSTYPT